MKRKIILTLSLLCAVFSLHCQTLQRTYETLFKSNEDFTALTVLDCAMKVISDFDSSGIKTRELYISPCDSMFVFYFTDGKISGYEDLGHSSYKIKGNTLKIYDSSRKVKQIFKFKNTDVVKYKNNSGVKNTYKYSADRMLVKSIHKDKNRKIVFTYDYEYNSHSIWKKRKAKNNDGQYFVTKRRIKFQEEDLNCKCEEKVKALEEYAEELALAYKNRSHGAEQLKNYALLKRKQTQMEESAEDCSDINEYEKRITTALLKIKMLN